LYTNPSCAPCVLQYIRGSFSVTFVSTKSSSVVKNPHAIFRLKGQRYVATLPAWMEHTECISILYIHWEKFRE